MTPLEFFDNYAANYRPYKKRAWCYEDGLLYLGLVRLHEATGEQRFLDHLVRLTGEQISGDGSLTGYTLTDFNIDNIMAGRCLFYLEKAVGDAKYSRAADLLSEQLSQHPRTHGGNYWHKKVYPHQVWLDGLYMALPFQIEYGLSRKRPELISDAVFQLSRAMDITALPGALYVHGCDEEREQKWADPVTGQSASCWGRALGWLAMALVDTAALIGLRAFDEAGLTARTTALFNRLLDLQQGDGLWLQVIDRPDLKGNYSESSASAMFAYSFLRAARSALWPAGAEAGQEALQALYKKALRQNAKGETHFEGICHVAGLGGFSGTYRDGSPEYYLTEPIVADDPKGVGPLMKAEAERLLLATALAPSAIQKSA